MTTWVMNDLEFVTATAREMVTKYGMSDLSAMALEKPDNEVFLGRGFPSQSEYSEEVATKIDHQVRQIVGECYEKACALIRDNRSLVDYVVDLLVVAAEGLSGR